MSQATEQVKQAPVLVCDRCKVESRQLFRVCLELDDGLLDARWCDECFGELVDAQAQGKPFSVDLAEVDYANG